MSADPAPPVAETDEKEVCAYHPDVETRLKCKTCGNAICTDCMTHCEVGITCKVCLSGFGTHLNEVSVKDYALGGGFSAGAGALLGFFMPHITGFSILGWIVLYFASNWLGQGVHRLARNKMHPRLHMAAVLLFSLGLLLSPVGSDMYYTVQNLSENGGESYYTTGLILQIGAIMVSVFAYQMSFRPRNRL